jgi:hypothetical protein
LTATGLGADAGAALLLAAGAEACAGRAAGAARQRWQDRNGLIYRLTGNRLVLAGNGGGTGFGGLGQLQIADLCSSCWVFAGPAASLILPLQDVLQPGLLGCLNGLARRDRLDCRNLRSEAIGLAADATAWPVPPAVSPWA